MATKTTTISGNVCNTYVHMDLVVTETSTNIANNTSAISWKLVAYLGSGASSAYWYSNSYHAISVVINGSTVYSLANTTQKNISIGTNTSSSSPLTIASGTATIPHNSDGTKTCACSFSCVYRYNSAFTWRGSGNVALTAIARATVPTAQPSADIGNTINIVTNGASEDFKHKLSYSFGNIKDKEIAAVAEKVTSTSWTIPNSLANEIPNSSSGVCTIICRTYNGNTYIGSNSISLTLKVPSSMKPTVSSIACSDAEGYLSKYGAYVQGKSKLSISVYANASYSSIKSYNISANGTTYNKSSVTTDVIKNAGSISVSASVTDGRGRSGSGSTTINNVASYSSPAVSSFTAKRCNSDGTINDTGNYISVSFSWTITPLNNKNSSVIKLFYKKNNESWSSTANYSYSDYSRSVTEVFPADSDYSYDIKLGIRDDFNNLSYTKEVGSVFVLLDFKSNGKGIAIGQVSDNDMFECSLSSSFNKGLSVVKDGHIPLVIRGNDTGSDTYIQVQNGDGVIGYIGIGVDGSIKRSNSGFTSFYKSLDSGNYSNYVVPKTGGTYTGGVTLSGKSSNLAIKDTSNNDYCRARINAEGTTSAVGIGQLMLGNAIVQKTAGNARGLLTLYGTSSGYTHLYGGNNTTSNINIYLPSAAGTIALTSSDSRLKENIEDSEVLALDIINSIQTHSFDWIESGDHWDCGYIADELLDIDEHFVLEGSGGLNEDGSINPLCIDSFYISAYHTKAIQELSEIVDKQQKEIDELKKLVNQLLDNKKEV